MNIVDKTKEVAARCKPGRVRSEHLIDSFLVHRFGPKENGVNIYGAEDVAAFFAANPEYTGGAMGYHYIVRDDGLVELAVPHNHVAYHALSWNVHSIGIACIGDFRSAKPTAPQYAALGELLVHLCKQFKLGPHKAIRGHDECPSASRDPYKKCPGKLLDMDELRLDVEWEMVNAGT